MTKIASCLDGIKVIDVSRLYPGPFCTMILADNGADVIAIEDKRYKSDNLFIQSLYRNKRHMNLNLKKPKAREVFFKLVKDADVFVEGFRPGVVEKLGIGYKEVSSVNPKIIYLSLSGYGQTGPFFNRAGHDVNYLSYAGILDLIGLPHHPPCIPGIQIADVIGALYGVIGILMALIAREKTGEGQYIDVSLTDASLSLATLLLFFKELTGINPERANTFLSHRYACYNTYETKDKRAIAIGAVEYRFWKEICEFFGCEEYIPLQYDDSKKEEIIAFFRAKFKEKTLDEWKKELKDCDFCWSEVLHFHEAIDHELFRQRDMVFNIENSEGRIFKTIGFPIKFSKNPGSIRRKPVKFGENTVEILKSLGYTENEFHEIL